MWYCRRKSNYNKYLILRSVLYVIHFWTIHLHLINTRGGVERKLIDIICAADITWMCERYLDNLYLKMVYWGEQLTYLYCLGLITLQKYTTEFRSLNVNVLTATLFLLEARKIEPNVTIDIDIITISTETSLFAFLDSDNMSLQSHNYFHLTLLLSN